jgi:predicted nucleic acid-binding Zn ribbon protein
MPTYEYHCDRNGRTLEVSHKMAEQLSTWGELCARAGVNPGKTAANTPVRKLISASAVLSGKSTAAAAEPAPCEMGAACCGNACSLQ